MARSGCIYGSTGSRKTTAVKHFAHYIAETTGKSTLLLSADGGGWAACDPEIAVDMIRPYRVETATLPLSILRRISQGYWPIDPEETEPKKITMRMSNWNEVGGIAVEGWSSMSQMLMAYAANKALKGGGKDDDYTGVFSVPITIENEDRSGVEVFQEKFGPNTRNHYNFVQNQLHSLTANLSSLPVRYVLFTALESKTEDDDRSTIYGPAIAGKKATAQCGSWVGDLIHAQDYAVPREVEVPDPSTGQKVKQQVIDTAVRFYFKKHPDPATGIMFPAKPRVTPEKVREMDQIFPGGYFEPTPEYGFDRYLHTLDKLAAGQADSLKDWRAKVDAKLGRNRPVAVGEGKR